MGFCSSGACVYLHDSACQILWLREEFPDFQALHVLFDFREFVLYFLERGGILFFKSKFEQDRGIFELSVQAEKILDE